jgi:hypothetical protein
MKKFVLAALAVTVPLSMVHAMSAAVFLQKAEALQKRGMMAMFSSDLRLLKGEVRTATMALKAEGDAARKAGRPTAFCPPKKVSLNSNELLAHLRSIPPAQRQTMEMRDALRQLMVRRYPCRR